MKARSSDIGPGVVGSSSFISKGNMSVGNGKGY